MARRKIGITALALVLAAAADGVCAQVSEPRSPWEAPPAELQRLPDLLAYAGRVVPPVDSARAIEGDSAQPAPQKWDRALPFFAQRVIDRGYQLPNPYDVGLSLYASRQDMIIENLQVAFNGGPRRDVSFLGFDADDLHTQSAQFQFGAWLFPFLNVFGIVGKVKGGGDIGITIPGKDLMEFVGVPGCGLPNALQPDLCKRTISGTAHASYDGSSVGGGFSLAGAHGDLFFSLPVSYVVNYLSISDTPTRAWNVAPRVGWNWHPKNAGMITSYVGMTWLKSSNQITGTFHFDTANTVIGKDTELAYDMHERQKKAWNYMVGAHWMISRSWSLLGEVGFGETRQDILVTGFYRF